LRLLLSISFIDNFEAIQKIFARKTSKIDAEFGAEIKDIKKAIGFQFWLNNEISLLCKKKSKWPLKKYEQLVLIFMFRNTHYLLACLPLCRQGLISPCYNNLRTVYETILKMYYLFEYPQEAELLWAYYDEKLNPKPKVELKNKKWFGHSYLIDKLYSDSTQKALRESYKQISQRSHPNVFGAFLDARLPSKLPLDSIQDCMRSILTLSYFNSAALADVFLDIIDTSIRGKIREELEDILASLGAGTSGKYPTFEPDKPSIPTEPKIKGGLPRI